MKYCNKCGTKAELKEFKTFSYHWCPKCKDEVVEKEPIELSPSDVVTLFDLTPPVWSEDDE